MLTNISGVPYADRGRVQKRFEYLLPRFVEPCSDIDTAGIAGDMAVRTLQVTEDTGVTVNLLELVEGMHSIVQTSQLVLNGAAPCLQYMSMYSVARSNGLSHDEAVNGMLALLGSLH